MHSNVYLERINPLETFGSFCFFQVLWSHEEISSKKFFLLYVGKKPLKQKVQAEGCG